MLPRAAAAASAVSSTAAGGTDTPPRVFASGREDGRFVTSTGFIHAHLKHLKPKLEFDPEMNPTDYPAWQDAVRAKLLELMSFPEFNQPQPPPKLLWSKQQDGYQLQKWEAYPEPYSVVPYLVLVPDGISAQSPGPGVMCFPGSFSSKESLAGELELDGKPCSHRHAARNRMALEYVRKGIVSVAVENPATNELDDPIRKGSYEFSVHALWAGRCYESISVFQKHHILQWLKQQPYVDDARIAVSGHSLGAKPALILGVLDPMIKAVVWNDTTIDWRRRAVATNLYRIGTFQYVPGLLAWFDYSDLQASLAPRPFLITEGGRTAVLNKIRQAYRLLDASDRFTLVYYPKYATPELRPLDDQPVPEGLSMEEYFPYANIDAPAHCFKGNIAVPWLVEVLRQGGMAAKPASHEQ
mgnify:FL=1|jgi:hypothetical protein